MSLEQDKPLIQTERRTKKQLAKTRLIAHRRLGVDRGITSCSCGIRSLSCCAAPTNEHRSRLVYVVKYV